MDARDQIRSVQEYSRVGSDRTQTAAATADAAATQTSPGCTRAD